MGSEDIKIADNEKNTRKNWRRKTDDPEYQEFLSQKERNGRFRIFSGFLTLGVISAIFTVGFSSGGGITALETVVKKVEVVEKESKDSDKNIKEELKEQKAIQTKILLTQTKILAKLDKNDEFKKIWFEQQDKSDKEFLRVITPLKDKLNNIEKEVIRLGTIQKLSKLKPIKFNFYTIKQDKLAMINGGYDVRN